MLFINFGDKTIYMKTTHGIQVYEILENGNLLNGIYTNTDLLHDVINPINKKKEKHYYIDSEIARKITYDNEGVKGIYECRYIETNNKLVTNCKLEISKHNEVFEFRWSQGDELIWEGLGLMAGTMHISVSYI